MALGIYYSMKKKIVPDAHNPITGSECHVHKDLKLIFICKIKKLNQSRGPSSFFLSLSFLCHVLAVASATLSGAASACLQ